MPSALVDVLAYGHIISAMMWLGGGILTSFVVGPNVRKMAPPAALEFNAKVLPRMVRFVQAAIGSTLLFGALLVYFLYDGSLSWLTASNQGYAIMTGMTLALITAAVAFSVVLPSFKKVGNFASEALAAGKPPAPEMMKYALRAKRYSVVALVLLLTTLSMMVAAGFNYP